jgi:hypothetical protein
MHHHIFDSVPVNLDVNIVVVVIDEDNEELAWGVVSGVSGEGEGESEGAGDVCDRCVLSSQAVTLDGDDFEHGEFTVNLLPMPISVPLVEGDLPSAGGSATLCVFDPKRPPPGEYVSA